ncbi:MAG: signal peptide peptidase SppA [Alphaproteobacteria bacterium]|nr:signal peptide peptidase SppA [Alphaproteobacteria bacterium]
MVAFLRWSRNIALGTLNGIAKVVLFVVVLIVMLAIIGMVRGDGLPDKMVLTADLRASMPDSSRSSAFEFSRPLTIMDFVLGLDRASRDSRVKGLFLRVGDGDLSVPQAQEIVAALKRFRQGGRFVVAHSQGFDSGGLGDYLAASGASEIWMQPKATFAAAGAGAGTIFLKGFFDKIQAEPQMVKRAEYKSAADLFMEKDYTDPDREQTTAFLKSWYDTATQGVAAERRLQPSAIAASFEKSPQFAEDAKATRLIDKLGYDDDAKDSAVDRSGGAKTVALRKYVRAVEDYPEAHGSPQIAVIQAAGEITEGGDRGGPFDSGSGIGSDTYATAIREAVRNSDVKAIVLRVDSPGGSVSASDQILHALQKARRAGKPVVVSMGMLAASGGYYISSFADRIVAEPGTLTGSIGVLTGKVSFGKTAGLLGIGVDQIGVGKNALMNSAIRPYTPDQLANLNHQADVIYSDFLQKVATGRKLPLAQVQSIAKGRVWTGADAKKHGLVDELGGFWTAVADAKRLSGIGAGEAVSFQMYPRRTGFFTALASAMTGTAAGVRTMQGLAAFGELPVAHVFRSMMAASGQSGVQMRATNLPMD